MLASGCFGQAGTLVVPLPRVGDRVEYEQIIDMPGGSQNASITLTVGGPHKISGPRGGLVDAMPIRWESKYDNATSAGVYQVSLSGLRLVRQDSQCVAFIGQACDQNRTTYAYRNWPGMPWGWGSSLFQGRTWKPGERYTQTIEVSHVPVRLDFEVTRATSERATIRVVSNLSYAPNVISPIVAYSGEFEVSPTSPYVTAARFSWSTFGLYQTLERPFLVRVSQKSYHSGNETIPALPSAPWESSKPCLTPGSHVVGGVPPVAFTVPEFNTSMSEMVDYYAASSPRWRDASQEADFHVLDLLLHWAGGNRLSPAGVVVRESNVHLLQLTFSGQDGSTNSTKVTRTVKSPNPLNEPPSYAYQDSPPADARSLPIPLKVHDKGLVSLESVYEMGRPSVQRPFRHISVQLVENGLSPLDGGFEQFYLYSLFFDEPSQDNSRDTQGVSVASSAAIRWDSRTGCLFDAVLFGSESPEGFGPA